MVHPLTFLVITEDTALVNRRYSLTGDTPQRPAYWQAVVANLKRVSVYPPDATHPRAVIRLGLYRKGGLGTEWSSMPSRLSAYALPTSRHVFLAEYDGVEEGMLFDIVSRVTFPGLAVTHADLEDLMRHPSPTVRTFALTHIVPILPPLAIPP